ncbi:MAG: beta-hydroxyacyl-ACP dehydratase [Planctomycetes bacterium]|nr:beta-hydroxyacyl-ACP dehydratase [Planctomycetota bacterium]NOG55209.1 beta-hydroxyacyl-ACP dehydratase [Planctomycetota bacterium]
MRWMWIDQIVEVERGQRLVAIKNVSLAEDVVHDHFPTQPAPNGEQLDALPVMPASLLIEGMAQTAGILVGHANDFAEKVILAKINKARFTCDVFPGQTVRFEARIDRMDESGASATGQVSAYDHARQQYHDVGTVELMFSHIDQNMTGLEFPEENFVFTDNFKTLLRAAELI